MDEQLKLELSKLINPSSILPSLRLPRPRVKTQFDISPDDSNQSDASEEIYDVDYKPEERTGEPPNKRKRSLPTRIVLSDKISDNREPQAITSSQLHCRLQGDKVIEFCQDYGLVARQVFCSCGKPMRLVSKSGNDGCRWMCYIKSHSARPNQTLRKGTWFESSKLSISDILWLGYMWVHEYSITSMMHECDHSNSTVLGWCTSCTEFCREIIKHKSKPIGGKGISVEIFHCTITQTKRSTGRWVFCATELHTANSLHLVIDDKNSLTLVEMLDRNILPGTKLLANNWSLLKDLNVEDFNFLTQKKSISFVYMATNKEMDTFEMFNRMAGMSSKEGEWSKFEYGPEFFEKMYRKCLSNTPDPFIAFLKDVAMIYKPCETYSPNPPETTK